MAFSPGQDSDRSRRMFLRQSFLGTLFLAFGRFGRSLPAVQATSSLLFFSDDEYRIMSAIAARMAGIDKTNPLSPSEVASRADSFLAAEPPEIQDQFHTLLYAFNAPLFAFLFDWRFSSFINMSPDDQDSYLEDWMTSNLAFRRTGFQGLKRLSLSMYYTDSRSWPEIHYEGMFLPWER